MDDSQFDIHAEIEDSHWWFKARREIIFDALKRYVSPNGKSMIAEIGCGTGGNLKFLKKWYRVIGVDISPEAVRYSSERVDCEVLLGDFREKLIDRWKNIDAVILPDIIEHIDDDASFLGDIVSNLRVGGVILITVPAYAYLWSTHDVILGHKRRYSPSQLRLL